MSIANFDTIAAGQPERILAKFATQAEELEADLIRLNPEGPGRLILDATISGHAQAHPLEKLHALRRLQKQLIPQILS